MSNCCYRNFFNFCAAVTEYFKSPQSETENSLFCHRSSPPREGPVLLRLRTSCCHSTEIPQQKGPDLEQARKLQVKVLPILVIGVVAVLGFVFLRDYLSFQALAENRHALEMYRDDHYAMTVVVFMLIYALIVAFSLPGATVATLTGGFLFATFPGALFNMLAATIGATAIFMAAKTGLGDRLAAKMDAGSGRWHAIKEEIDRDQWSILFIMRLVPVIPFFVANVLPALVGVPLSRFVISTFLGIIPGAIVYTSVGAGLGSVFDRGETPDLGIIFEPQILLPLLGLAALSLLPVIIRKFRKGI